MKKILLTTTALVTVFCIPALAVPKNKVRTQTPQEIHAQSPLNVKVDGILDAQAGFRSQNSKYVKNEDGNKIGVSKYNKDLGFDTEGRVNIKAKGKTQKGLLYGANIGLDLNLKTPHEKGTEGIKPKSSSSLMKRRTFIYLQDKDMGRLELGNREGASEAMLPTAEYVAAATGGIGGDWYKYVVTTNSKASSGAFDANNFYMGAGSLLDNGTGASSIALKSRKITYYTPEIKDTGLRFGISYIPDSENSIASYPNISVVDATKDKGYKNGFVGGLDWKYKIDKDNTFKLAVVGEYATLPKEIKAKYEKAQTVGAGLTHTYKDFSSAISYNYLGKSGLVKNAKIKPKKDNYVATLGFAYDIDKKTKVSLTGLMSEKWKNKFYNVSLGAEYQLAPGLLPYAEVSFFEMKQKYKDVSSVPSDKDAKAKNKGTAFIIGTKVAF
jgi:predicted porin